MNRILLFLSGLIFAPLCMSQNNFWTFPEQYVDEINSAYLPTSDYTGANSDFAHAGIRDPYGKVVFFMVDGVVYSKTGSEIGLLENEVGYPIYGRTEALIVPFPGSCEDFYIFTSGFDL